MEENKKLIRSLVEDYYDIQHYRIMTASQLLNATREDSQQHQIFIKEKVHDVLFDIEKNIVKFLQEVLKNEELYTSWLSKVKGIGPIHAAALTAWIGGHERFATISKLWAYSGYSAGYVKYHCTKKHKVIGSSMPATCPVMGFGEDKKCGEPVTLDEKVEGKPAHAQAGYLLMQNTRLKSQLWNIGESFVKTKGGYRKLYEEFRGEYNEKWVTSDDCGSMGCKNKGKIIDKTKKIRACLDGHKYEAAKRKTIKVFLAHYWQMSRKLNNLSVDNPFIIGKTINGTKHTRVIPIVVDEKK